MKSLHFSLLLYCADQYIYSKELQYSFPVILKTENVFGSTYNKEKYVMI